ncbi:MAG: hypothetical protein AAF242_00010 [Bacteroidota bacterium]
MPVTSIQTIKNWFKTGLRPLQEQYHAWMDSYWHKNETIPTSSIETLDAQLNDINTRIGQGGLTVGGKYNSDEDAGLGGVLISNYYVAGPDHREGVREGTPIQRLR